MGKGTARPLSTAAVVALVLVLTSLPVAGVSAVAMGGAAFMSDLQFYAFGAGLVCGLVAPFVGAGLGIAALRDVRREKSRGRGAALTSVILGGLLGVLYVSGVVVVAFSA